MEYLILQETYIMDILSESPHWGDSNNFPQHMFLRVNKKKKKHNLPFSAILGFIIVANLFYGQNLGEEILSL